MKGPRFMVSDPRIVTEVPRRTQGLWWGPAHCNWRPEEDPRFMVWDVRALKFGRKHGPQHGCRKLSRKPGSHCRPSPVLRGVGTSKAQAAYSREVVGLEHFLFFFAAARLSDALCTSQWTFAISLKIQNWSKTWTPFWGPKNGPQNGVHFVVTIGIKMKT